MKASKPIIVFRPVSPAKRAVLTLFDAERKGRSLEGLVATIIARGVENEPPVYHGRVSKHRDSQVIGSTLAAEFAALVTALGRQLYARLLLESILFWRKSKRYWLAITIENPWDHGERC